MASNIDLEGHATMLDAVTQWWWAPTVESLQLPHSAFLIYSEAEAEERAHISHWESHCESLAPSQFAVVKSQSSAHPPSFHISSGGRTFDVEAFDFGSLHEIVPEGASVVVDISGVDHMFWAACMVGFPSRVAELYFVYTEPAEYKLVDRDRSEEDFATGRFDLSYRSRGVSPLPRFANLMGPEMYGGQSIFVPLLGFEGRRAMKVLSGLDPTPMVVPVVGLPGYRVEFPSHTIACNEAFFQETRSEARIRYAAANNPFAARDALRQIASDFPGRYMYIAPIGTRPHAVGALMFANAERGRSEILFDHPMRKPKSRKGVGSAHLYKIFGSDGL